MGSWDFMNHSNAEHLKSQRKNGAFIPLNGSRRSLMTRDVLAYYKNRGGVSYIYIYFKGGYCIFSIILFKR